MRTIALFIVILVSAVACSNKSAKSHMATPSIAKAQFDQNERQRLISREAEFANERYKEENGIYIHYFTQGLDSESETMPIGGKVSHVMIIAFRKGFQVKDAYIKGYLEAASNSK
jgi:hypothetical protein